MRHRHFRFYDKIFGSDPDYWRETSPFYRLSDMGASMLLVCSKQRGNSCAQARRFAEKATADGRKAIVLPVALSHMEINENLGLATPYTQAVDAFLRTLGIGNL